MKKADYLAYEKTWQTYWDEKKIYKTPYLADPKNKKYTLVMFPYPSGAGLHVGHARIYTGTDVLARYYRMNGYSVLHPMGWDGFGLPAENAAIKEKKNPRELTEVNIKNFKRQMKMLGLSYDWEREINTTDPEYYAVTQWLFILFFTLGLLYKKDTPVYYCPSCKTGLAREEVTGEGKHERCGNDVEKRNLPQWIFRITKYADSLLEGLKSLEWPNGVLEMQKNWIGKKDGINITYNVVARPALKKSEAVEHEVNNQKELGTITCFTTRPETNFGATFVVLAPEHQLSQRILSRSIRIGDEALYKSIEAYIFTALKKTERERISEGKAKTGVWTGLYAFNPLNKAYMPIWISDFVLKDVGTGAVVAVPGHDMRDFEFAETFHLPVKIVIKPKYEIFRSILKAKDIQKEGLEQSGAFIRSEDDKGNLYLEIPQAKFELFKSTMQEKLKNDSYAVCVGDEIWLLFKDDSGNKSEYILNNSNAQDVIQKYTDYSGYQVENISDIYFHLASYEWYRQHIVNEGEGIIMESDFINGLSAQEGKKKMIRYLEEQGWGESTKTYHLRDWIFSRQRYWGEPIPMIFCQSCHDNKRSYWSQEEASREINLRLKDSLKKEQYMQNISEIEDLMYGWYPMKKKDLPLPLPDVDHYEPLESGESPLAALQEWKRTICPVCGGEARRETDTMPNWAGSCWYFLRFACGGEAKNGANNKKHDREEIQSDNYNDNVQGNDKMNAITDESAPWNRKEVDAWMPVDWYVGGAEQAVLHLLYARFWMHVFNDVNLTSCREPFRALTNIGMVLAEDGRKMSKSFGNVINPDDIVKEYGADTLRIYEMFMAPFTQEIAWSIQNLQGSYRFVNRIWQIYHDTAKITNDTKKHSVELDAELQTIITKITQDITDVKFNTCIAALMEFLNMWQKSDKTLSLEQAENFAKLLAPFAPYVSEEIWHKIFHKKTSIHQEKWPEGRLDLVSRKKITIPVQINGKVREVLADNVLSTDKETVVKKALESEKVRKWIEGKKYSIIYVEGRILNIITE